MLTAKDNEALASLSHSLTVGDGGVALVTRPQSPTEGVVVLETLSHSLTTGEGVALASLSHSLTGDHGKELVGERKVEEIGEGVRGDTF